MSGEDTGDAGQRRHRSTILIAALSTVVLVAAAVFAFVAVRHRDANGVQGSSLRAEGIPANVSTSLANMMALSRVPGTVAPNFSLIDQEGRTMSLDSFRGRPVILEFMDSHCTDICPIVSQEFVKAYHDLAPSGSGTVFMAVNVNPYHHSVSDVAAFSRLHGLDAIPTWHFFTGPVSTLKPVWRSYNIDVQAPSPSADVLHSSEIIFIDASGHERYIAAPTDDHTKSGRAYLPAGSILAWGKGIALVTRDIS